MKITTALSLTLNGLLAGGVLWLAGAGARPERRAEFSRFLTNRVLRLPLQPATPLASEPVTAVVETTEPFCWAQLESADYRIYLANLRAFGCPEATVRDILVADVNELFNARVKALVDEVSGQFWHYLTHEKELDQLINEKGKQVRELDQQRGELFTTLFGNENPRAEEAQRAFVADNREQWERVADFLPAEKRARFAAAKAELERAWMGILRTPDLTNAQRQEKRKALEGAHEQALREWLAPGEYDELRLRQSPAAGLRDRLVGMDLSEDTVRTVAKIQSVSSQEPAESQIRELLGPEAYAAFQRATDNRFEPIYRVAQRLELSDMVAAQAYDIRRQAEAAASRLRDYPSLAADEQQARLQAIGAETKQSLAAALGTQGFAAYQKIDGGWMQQLTVIRR